MGARITPVVALAVELAEALPTTPAADLVAARQEAQALEALLTTAAMHQAVVLMGVVLEELHQEERQHPLTQAALITVAAIMACIDVRSVWSKLRPEIISGRPFWS